MEQTGGSWDCAESGLVSRMFPQYWVKAYAQQTLVNKKDAKKELAEDLGRKVEMTEVGTGSIGTTPFSSSCLFQREHQPS